MKKMQAQVVEQVAIKAAASGGVLAASWSWIGTNHHQISVIFGFICTVIAVVTFLINLKHRKRDK